MVMGIQEESADTVCGRKRATDQMLKESFKKWVLVGFGQAVLTQGSL